MKTYVNNKNSKGFTLIEMVGVLAVIAILAALLIPKIFAAINESRYANTVSSINTIKGAAMTYFGKYGKFAGVNGVPLTTGSTNQWDRILLTEGLIEKPFQTRVGDSFVCVSTNLLGFDLDGDGSAAESTNGVVSIYCMITNISLVDAYEMSARIDGAYDPNAQVKLTASNNVVQKDLAGRVMYDFTTNTSGSAVYIYLAHK